LRGVDVFVMDIYRILCRELTGLQECVLENIGIRNFLQTVNQFDIFFSREKLLYNNNEYIVTCHLTFVIMNLEQFYPNPTHDIHPWSVTAYRLAGVSSLIVFN
jgi:hypothetical protein